MRVATEIVSSVFGEGAVAESLYGGLSVPVDGCVVGCTVGSVAYSEGLVGLDDVAEVPVCTSRP